MMTHSKLMDSLDELVSGVPMGKNQCVAGFSVKSQISSYDIPKDELSQQEVPSEAAYNMIQDDLALDIDPAHKYVLP